MMFDDRQKVIYGILTIIAVTILMLSSFSSFYSSVYALSSQSSDAHHKVSDKKQDSGTSSKDASNGGGDGSSDNSRGSSSSRSDKTLGHTDDGGNTDKNQRSGENVPLTGTDTSMPQTTCEQGSNCTDQQTSTDSDRSIAATPATKQDYNNTPFVLSVPFP